MARSMKSTLILALAVNSLVTIVIKWLSAVLFYKVFEVIASSTTNGGSNILFDTENAFWRFVYLKTLSFGFTLILCLFFIFIHSLLNVYITYEGQTEAERNKRRYQHSLIFATAKGSSQGNSAEGLTKQASLTLENIDKIYSWEKELRCEVRLRQFVEAWAILILFIISPVISLIFALAYSLTVAFGVFINRYFISLLDEKRAKAEKSLHSRCLDISRNADVVAVCRKLEKELCLFNEEADKLAPIVKATQFYFSSIVFTRSALIATMFPCCILLVFYEYENLSDDPIDFTFSLFVFLTLLDEIHKSISIEWAASNTKKDYEMAKSSIEKWIGGSSNMDDSARDQQYNQYDSCDKSSDNTEDSRILDVIVPAEKYSGANKISTAGSIRLENISISFLRNHNQKDSEDRKDEVIVIENRSFVFPYQKSTALVGESGSGKSSIIKVLAGLLIPKRGRVFFGDVELYNGNGTDEIRKKLAYCSQDSVLFARTIRDNIWYANHDPVDDELILDALQTVGLSQWLSNQGKGLDTMLELAEMQVSGGQAQRIKLARLLCKRQAETILLDEAFSALDSVNRKRILKSLNRFLKGKTTICVTHHPDVINIMDTSIEITTHKENKVENNEPDHYIGSTFIDILPTFSI